MGILKKIKGLFEKLAESIVCYYHKKKNHSYITTVPKDKFYKYEAFALKSVFLGKYIYKPYYPEEETKVAELWGTGPVCEVRNFAESYDAFKQFLNDPDFSRHSQALTCRRLILQFNYEYAKEKHYDKASLIADFPKFVDVVFYFLGFSLPLIVKADLYRQIGMFDKCFELLNILIKDRYDAEIADEIRIRAYFRDRYPFNLFEVETLQPLCRCLPRMGYVDWFFENEY